MAEKQFGYCISFWLHTDNLWISVYARTMMLLILSALVQMILLCR